MFVEAIGLWFSVYFPFIWMVYECVYVLFRIDIALSMIAHGNALIKPYLTNLRLPFDCMHYQCVHSCTYRTVCSVQCTLNSTQLFRWQNNVMFSILNEKVIVFFMFLSILIEIENWSHQMLLFLALNRKEEPFNWRFMCSWHYFFERDYFFCSSTSTFQFSFESSQFFKNISMNKLHTLWTNDQLSLEWYFKPIT